MFKWSLVPFVGAMASVAFAGDPGTVNSGAGSTAGFQGVVLSGQVTRSTDDGLSIVITNTCFGTNLRFVTNPISPYSIVNMTLIVKDHGVEKKIMVKYPASLVTPSGGLNSLAIPASAISAPAGMNVTGAVSGNVVRLNLPIASSVTVDENGNISQASIAAELGSVSFDQEFETPGNRGQYSGPYYENGMKSSVNPDDYRGYTGPLSASVYTAASKDKKTYNVAAYFPGENGFCGGFFSPLMVFFDDKRPEFKASVDFPLNPSGKSMWPEAGAPGAFIAIDRDGDGKITKAEELFGNESGKYKNGFEALREFDSNKDGVIDSKDKDFGKLLLWFDKNGDGISQKGELVPLKTKIKSISLKYDGSAVNSVAGRAQVRERSSFIFIEKGKEKKGEVIDLWFAPENH